MIVSKTCNNLNAIFRMYIYHIRKYPNLKAIASMYYIASTTIKIDIIGQVVYRARPHSRINTINLKDNIIDLAKKIYICINKLNSIKTTRLLGVLLAFMRLRINYSSWFHHPQMQLNKNALENGVNLWLNLIKKLENLK